MTNKELKKLLNNIKTERRGGAPHEGWVNRNRGILMMQVRNTTDSAANNPLGGILRHFFAIFAPTESFAMAARAIGIFLLVLGTMAGGGLVSAQVYRDAAPGDSFYRVKMALETAQLFLAPNADYKTKLHTEFADRRMDEAARLAEADSARQAHLPGVLSSFERDIAALQDGLETLKSEDPKGVAETAKLLERKMATYQNILRKAGSSLWPDYAPAIAQARDLVDGLTIRAMAVLVEKHLSGDEHAAGNVVASKMEDRLNQAEAKLEAADKAGCSGEACLASTCSGEACLARSQKAKAAIAEAKKLIKDENYQAALTKMEEVVELTKDDCSGGACPAPENGTETKPAEPHPHPTSHPVDVAAGLAPPDRHLTSPTSSRLRFVFARVRLLTPSLRGSAGGRPEAISLIMSFPPQGTSVATDVPSGNPASPPTPPLRLSASSPLYTTQPASPNKAARF